MENLATKLIRLFESSGYEVDLAFIELILKELYEYYGDLDERCKALEEELRRYQVLSSDLRLRNSELIATVRDTILKYQEIIAGMLLQQEAETAFKDKEAREKGIVGGVG